MTILKALLAAVTIIIGLLLFTLWYAMLSVFWFSGPAKAIGLLALAAIMIESPGYWLLLVATASAISWLFLRIPHHGTKVMPEGSSGS